MRIYLLTALILLTGPKAIHAQTAGAAPAGGLAPVTTSAATQQPRNEALPSVAAPAYAAGLQFAQSPNDFYLGGPDQPGAAAGEVGPLIFFNQHDSNAMDELAEDLNIFSFILKRNLESAVGEQMPEFKMGVPMLLESGGRRIHASYIEGFGAILNLRLRIPVVAPSAAPAKPVRTEGPTEWEKARAALYGGRTAVARADWAERSDRQAEHYDAKVVDIIKKQVIESLKSAANLRHVKADEWVVVAIKGSPDEAEPQTAPVGRLTGAAGRPAQVFGTGGSGLTSFETRASGRPTMMTIRVKKSVVDALGSKGGSAEQFADKVEVATYLGAEVSAGGSSSANVLWQSNDPYRIMAPIQQ